MDCSLVAVLGTIVVVGPVELAPHDTTYRYIIIREQNGALRDFTMVRAVPDVSELVEQDATGMFVFCETDNDCRLWSVARTDGSRALDLDTMQRVIAAAD